MHDHGSVSEGPQTPTSKRRLAWALGVTGLVLVVEIVGGILSGSLALIADAAHMAADSMGLVIALITAHLMARPRSDRWTWGFARAEILGAGLQAGLLTVLSVVIVWQAVERLFNPEVIEPIPMLIVGAIGLTANVASMGLLFGGRKDSLNLRAAFLEVTADALGSVAVIVAALIALWTGWFYADSIASLAISLMIGFRAIAILRQAVRVLLERTPDGLDLGEVRDAMMAFPQVVEVHDLHASQIGTGVNVLTAHVVVSDQCVKDGETVSLLHSLQNLLADSFGVSINHATIQIDSEKHAEHEELAH